ncbi:MAG: beta-propeller fold lactonase family protein, partial [Acetobacteraceae bacterium]|nr:beta-propeller fold lactonase family protein [Acetobacteraceae bacterium]
MPALTLYAIGPRLHRYAVDPETGELTHAESVKLPGNGQYAVFHPGGNCLYVAVGKPPQPLSLLAFAIDLATGALRPHGDPVSLSARAIHLDIDPAGLHLFVSLLDPGTVRVVWLDADGRIGAPVGQSEEKRLGVFLHQARVLPFGEAVLACTRGNDAANGKPEEKGALSFLAFRDGALRLAQQ